MPLKSGPLSVDELRAVWLAAVDPAYSDPLIAAGDGSGLEVHSVLWQMLARASVAVDVCSQALFIAPWSGQTNPPAAGEAFAVVDLTFARSSLVDRAMTVGEGQVLVEELAQDWGDLGAVPVLTGRRYLLLESAVFPPGDVGPRTVPARAELPGYGYNNPFPGTIRSFVQPGTGLNNVLASVAIVGATATLTSANTVDQFIPDNVGQYVLLTAGANAGVVARILSFVPPSPPLVGSGVVLEQTISFEASAFSGTFAEDEPAIFTGGQAVTILGAVPGGAGLRVVGALASGNLNAIAPGSVLTGSTSGATATVLAVVRVEQLVAESGTAAWRVLDWAVDWAATSSNALSPTGGVSAFLDELGAERNIGRAPGEVDDVYRKRVQAIADVVSPNAIKRALSKTMGAIPYCYRETETALLPGFFFDGDNSPTGGLKTVNSAAGLAAAFVIDAYDTDSVVWTGTYTSGTFLRDERVEYRTSLGALVVDGYYGSRLTGTVGSAPVDVPSLGGTKFLLVRKNNQPVPVAGGDYVIGLRSGAIFTPTVLVPTPTAMQRRFRVLLDYAQFRAFFLVGVPPVGADDFGFAYDAGAFDAYDAAPYEAFYDGAALGAAQFYGQVYQAVDQVRAGGVSFDLYVELVGCP